MGLLHYEDHVCPAEQLWGEHVFGIIVQSGRRDLDALPRCEELLGSRTAKPILAANEQDAFHCVTDAPGAPDLTVQFPVASCGHAWQADVRVDSSASEPSQNALGRTVQRLREFDHRVPPDLRTYPPDNSL